MSSTVLMHAGRSADRYGCFVSVYILEAAGGAVKCEQNLSSQSSFRSLVIAVSMHGIVVYYSGSCDPISPTSALGGFC